MRDGSLVKRIRRPGKQDHWLPAGSIAGERVMSVRKAREVVANPGDPVGGGEARAEKGASETARPAEVAIQARRGGKPGQVSRGTMPSMA